MTLVTRLDQKRELLRQGRKPLVGYVSQRNTIAVSDRDGGIVVTTNAATRTLVAGMGVLFGPGLAMLFVALPERFSRMPIFIRAVVVIAIAGATLALLRTLFRSPRVAIGTDGVVRGSGLSPIAPSAIRSVFVDKETYTSANQRIVVPNAVLVLQTTDGDVRLCASPDTKLIQSLATGVAALTRTSHTTTNELLGR